MLVCNVSLRPPRRSIAAVVGEAASATDATATGNIVFAALVDDPASVRDFVDAYSGEIMLEAASADATATAGSAYGTGLTEDTTATATVDAALSALVPRNSVVAGQQIVFINSDGTSRTSGVPGVMINEG